MSNLNAFLATNAKSVGTIKGVVSSRFVDENGKPIEWEFRALTAEEDELLRKQYLGDGYKIKGDKVVVEPDSVGYMTSLLCKSVVFPDLMNAELQDSYGVQTPEDLIKTMLLAGEFNKAQELSKKANEAVSLDELQKEVKNV